MKIVDILVKHGLNFIYFNIKEIKCLNESRVSYEQVEVYLQI